MNEEREDRDGTSVIDELLEANRAFAEGRAVGPASSSASPRRRVVIVTCMDCRLEVRDALGLAEGEAHILRNAGGSVTEDVIRSLAISQRVLGTRHVMVIHHTQCGMTQLTDDSFRAELLDATGMTPPFAIESFSDIEADVRQSLARVRHSPFLLGEGEVRGFVYDVQTHLLNEVA